MSSLERYKTKEACLWLRRSRQTHSWSQRSQPYMPSLLTRISTHFYTTHHLTHSGFGWHRDRISACQWTDTSEDFIELRSVDTIRALSFRTLFQKRRCSHMLDSSSIHIPDALVPLLLSTCRHVLALAPLSRSLLFSEVSSGFLRLE